MHQKESECEREYFIACCNIFGDPFEPRGRKEEKQKRKKERRKVSTGVEKHRVGVFEVLLHEVEETGDCGSVKDAVIGRPTELDDVYGLNFSLFIESRQLLHPSDRSDQHLGQQQDGRSVRSSFSFFQSLVLEGEKEKERPEERRMSNRWIQRWKG